MKRMILSFVCSLMICACTAQPPANNRQGPPPQRTPAQVTKQMTQQLKLNKSQIAKVTTLNNKYSQLFKGPGFGPQDKDHKPQNGNNGPKPGGTPPPDMKQGNANQRPPQGPPTQKHDGKDPHHEDMNKMMKLRKSYDLQLKKILSAKQFLIYQKSEKRPAPPKKKSRIAK